MGASEDLDRLAEKRARGEPLTGADKAEAVGAGLQAAGCIVMCIVGLIILAVAVYACASA